MIDPLPRDWAMAPIGAILERRQVTVNPSSDPGQQFDMVGLEDISANGTGEIRRRSLLGAEILSAKTPFDSADVLYGKLRPYLNKVAVAGFSGICSTDIWAFKTSPLILPHYAYAFLTTDFFVGQIANLTQGANLPRVNAGVFDAMCIPLPPLSEQRRIVEILQEAEQVHRLRAQAEAKTAQLIPAIFRKMFGDPIANDRGFPVARLTELGELDRGRSRHRPRDADFLYGGPYPFIQTGDVAQSNGWIERFTQTYTEEGLRQSRLWPAGTLCITIAANIGETAILTFDACFPDSIVGFTPNSGVAVEYVRSWLLAYQAKLEAQAPSGAQKNINLKILGDIRIPNPPRDLQKLFSDRVAAVRELYHGLRSSKLAGEKVTSSLLSHAFTGELTAGWRAAHEAELREEAAERDRWLAGAGVSVARAPVADRKAVRVGEVECSDLSRNQALILRDLQGLVRDEQVVGEWITPESLSKRIKGRLRGNPRTIATDLDVLAARGLLIAASQEQEDPMTGEVHYGMAYRLPRDDGPETAEEDATLPNERIRLAEMERLSESIVRERTR